MEQFPTISQAILVLLLTDVLLVGAGMLLYWRWTNQEEAPPVWLTVVAGVASLVIYLAVTRFLYVESTNASIVEAFIGDPSSMPDPTESPEAGLYKFRGEPGNDKVIPILGLCLVFWTVPVAYFSNKIMAAFAAARLRELSWLEMELPDYNTPKYYPTDDFHEARQLAAEGDIEAAVERYLGYVKNRPHALMAAAKLLEVHGRFEEEAEILQKIRLEAPDNIELWSAATFRLATINERHLDNTTQAVNLFNQVATRAPETEYGEMAQTQLERLHPEGDTLLEMLDANFGEAADAAPPDEYGNTSTSVRSDFYSESRTQGAPGAVPPGEDPDRST